MLRFLCALSFLCCLLSPASAAAPNIVVFLVDDLGWSDLGCYGSEFYETPHIDQLAADGLRFTDAYATCHVCSPSRASLLTGKYPARLGLTDWIRGRRDFPFQRLLNQPTLQALPTEETTLAEALRSNGYATSIFGKWHLGQKPSDPTAHGFDVHAPDVPSNWRTFHAPFKIKGFADKPGDYLTDRVTDEAVDWLEEQDAPFFLYLSHFAVHDPIEGRADLVEKYRKKLAAQPKPEGPKFILEGNPDTDDPLTKKQLAVIAAENRDAFHVLPQRTVKIKQHQDNIELAAMVGSVDESLGRVRAKLDELGVAGDTIVLFTSDNGGMSASNIGNPKREIRRNQLDRAFAGSSLPLRGAKGWLYEGGIRVAAILHAPGKTEPGSTSSEPVISTDFFPTLLSLAGLPALPEQHLDGQDISPLIDGDFTRDAPLFWHFPHYSNHGMQPPASAIRDGDHKLIEYHENGTLQLFDLAADIGEHVDLSKTNPELAATLRDKLHAWRASLDVPDLKPNPGYDPSSYPHAQPE